QGNNGVKKDFSVPRASRRLRAKSLAVAVVVLLCLLGIAGPARVTATVHRLLTYVPGFGIQSSESFYLAAAQPVYFSKDGVSIEMRGLMADEKSTSVNVFVRGNLVLPNYVNASSAAAGNYSNLGFWVYLEDAAGNKYPLKGVSSSNTDGLADYWLSFKPLPRETEKVTLVLDKDWQISIPLAPSSQLGTLEQFGPAQTINGATVAAQVSALPDKTYLTLLIQGNLKGAKVASVDKVALETSGNKTIAAVYDMGGEGEVWNLNAETLSSDVQSVRVKLPSLTFNQPGSGIVVLPIPNQNESKELNVPVRIGDWTFTFVKAEIVLDDAGREPMVKVYTDLPVGTGPYVMGWHQLKVDGQLQSWQWKRDPQTDVMQYFQFYLPKGKQTTILSLEQPVVKVMGPWEIEVPVKH
ncbi:MAG TPA: hypothetical protein VNU93_01990, partial [Verrucomicrobiae bacterium]|nr:hypothetical protein [Verrucomicrobiae bacterium]